jgi:tRNA-splicing ligase RtcB
MPWPLPNGDERMNTKDLIRLGVPVGEPILLAHEFANLIESETRFGMGCEFKRRREHDVMDEDRSVSPVTNRLRDKGWAQLGTSGSGNHFVEFGAFKVESDAGREGSSAATLGLEPGE